MGNFNRGGGGRDFNRGSFRDRGSRGPVEMQQAVCDQCGKDCQVPFKPTNGKPIFCSECFESIKGSDSRRSEGNGRPNNFSAKGGSASGWEDRQMFSAVCDDCKKNCQVPFQPRGDKPIYCSECFGDKKGTDSNKREQPHNEQTHSDLKKQFESLNNKLDQILKLLAPSKIEVVKEKLVADQQPQEEITSEVASKPTKKRSSKKD